uniref:Uncharacterized protein n=1 Tax=Enterobacter sp. HP19 TaxID=1811975 RepID=A0A2H4UDZ2_9ENTR|nr:hypothetical protein [Enterobacter sp. HP19]
MTAQALKPHLTIGLVQSVNYQEQLANVGYVKTRYLSYLIFRL